MINKTIKRKRKSQNEGKRKELLFQTLNQKKLIKETIPVLLL
jgi:hypothetical protein